MFFVRSGNTSLRVCFCLSGICVVASHKKIFLAGSVFMEVLNIRSSCQISHGSNIGGLERYLSSRNSVWLHLESIAFFGNPMQ
jgi:hypothetical protein